MLTAKEKRQRLISNADILFMKGDPEWFRQIEAKLKFQLQDLEGPNLKSAVILKWITECENMAAITVKEAIRNHFEV